MPHVVEGSLVGFAVFGFCEDFEGPDFACFRLHALQTAIVRVCFVAQEPAGAVACAFNVETVQACYRGVDAEGFADV
jgi:hypothetical protein